MMHFIKQKGTTRNAIVLICILLAGWISLQAVSPEISNPPVTGVFTGPNQIKAIFERACYDCHSNETKLQWYDRLAPFSFQVAEDVTKARQYLNFSHWDSLSGTDRQTALWYMVNMIEAGKMPLPAYAALHPNASISEGELRLLKEYVAGLSQKNAIHTAGNKVLPSRHFPDTLSGRPHTVPDSFPESVNGIRYFDDYKQWKVISSTNRFDNGTIRLIYGNEITVKAITENRIHPWPDGAIVVKVVWNSQAEDTQGNVIPGSFNNVQIMIRDEKKFKATEGWGFARFNGPDLVPYGKTLSFASSCIRCHRLASDNGFVFDIPTKKLTVTH